MPCLHKFYEELYLENISYKPETLIIGTFNPAWPETNHAQWFYGRTHNSNGTQSNNFWDVLPRIYEGDSASLIQATPLEWKNFCMRNKIAITDLIYSIDDADENNPLHISCLGTYDDKKIAELFSDHIPVNVNRILTKVTSIRYVYLTRSASGKLWAKLWRIISNYCLTSDIRAQTLLTPSRQAWRMHNSYNAQNPNNHIIRLQDYILMRWREEWHF